MKSPKHSSFIPSFLYSSSDFNLDKFLSKPPPRFSPTMLSQKNFLIVPPFDLMKRIHIHSHAFYGTCTFGAYYSGLLGPEFTAKYKTLTDSAFSKPKILSRTFTNDDMKMRQLRRWLLVRIVKWTLTGEKLGIYDVFNLVFGFPSSRGLGCYHFWWLI